MPPKSIDVANLSVKGIPSELYEQWQEAAQRSHRSLSRWVVLALTKAAEVDLQPPAKAPVRP